MYSIYNDEKPTLDLSAMNFNQNFNNRHTLFTSNYKVGKNNKISNRLTCLNNKIELTQLNLDKESYKIKCIQLS